MGYRKDCYICQIPVDVVCSTCAGWIVATRFQRRVEGWGWLVGFRKNS